MFARFKPWQIIVSFALTGLLIAIALYAYGTFRDYARPEGGLYLVLDTASIVLCPPSLIFAACIDCEWTGWGGFAMFSIIGLMNAALYAAVGAAIASRRKKGS